MLMSLISQWYMYCTIVHVHCTLYIQVDEEADGGEKVSHPAPRFHITGDICRLTTRLEDWEVIEQNKFILHPLAG